jgi:hypothetical protein
MRLLGKKIRSTLPEKEDLPYRIMVDEVKFDGQ